MTTLVLVRHGQSESNLLEFFTGQSDIALVETGLRQAEESAKYIKNNYKADVLYASDLQRAYITGEIIGKAIGLDVIADSRLREIYAGEWEMKPFTYLKEHYSEEYSRWLCDIGNCHPTGGESVQDMGKRFISALEDIAKQNGGKTVVIATHATPIRACQCIFSGLTFDSMKDIKWVSNASVTEIKYENGNFTIVKAGHDEHLASLRTYLSKNA